MITENQENNIREVTTMQDDYRIKGLSLLRKEFDKNSINKLPKPTETQTKIVRNDYTKGIRCQECGQWHHPDVKHLDYVGHAATTNRLLDVDPMWNWEPCAYTEEGLPKFDSSGGLWIKLTVLGITRIGYGNAENKEYQQIGDREKEVIGDAIRNTAMRFGVALNLWHKGDLHAESSSVAVNDDRNRKDENVPGYCDYEKENLPAMRDAALNGLEALSAAFEALPKSEHKEAFWQAHGTALKKAAKTADEQ